MYRTVKLAISTAMLREMGVRIRCDIAQTLGPGYIPNTPKDVARLEIGRLTASERGS